MLPPGPNRLYDGMGVRMLSGPGCLTSLEAIREQRGGFHTRVNNIILEFVFIKMHFPLTKKKKKKFYESLLFF